jgi:hypothetical protein
VAALFLNQKIIQNLDGVRMLQTLGRILVYEARFGQGMLSRTLIQKR